MPAPSLTSVPSPARRPTSFVAFDAGAMVAVASWRANVPRPLMDANDSSAWAKETVAPDSKRMFPPTGVNTARSPPFRQFASVATSAAVSALSNTITSSICPLKLLLYLPMPKLKGLDKDTARSLTSTWLERTTPFT